MMGSVMREPFYTPSPLAGEGGVRGPAIREIGNKEFLLEPLTPRILEPYYNKVHHPFTPLILHRTVKLHVPDFHVVFLVDPG